MQYHSYDSRVQNTPVIGAVPQETQNFMPTTPFMRYGYASHPSYFGEYEAPTQNKLLAYGPDGFSRQGTTMNSRMNTWAAKPLSPGLGTFGSTKSPPLFRRRNSTNPAKNNKPRAFSRSNSSATNKSKVFVPKVYTTDVYPVKLSMGDGGKQNSIKLSFGSPFSNASTIVSRNNSYNRVYSNLNSYDSDRSSDPLSPRVYRRNPNFVKSSPFDRAFRNLKRDFELPKVDPKDAVRFFEGLVLAAMGIIRAILKEIRADIITGMFTSDDPNYDAARSYYYTSNNQQLRHSGFTERIDYIEAIENEKKNRLNEKKDSVRVESMREFANLGKKDFMEMTEREFEEFLLRQAYPDAPPYVPKF